jgi:hypothetical protein
MKTPEQYEDIISSLSRQLAAERLRADNGWARYENANMGQKLAREELARVVSGEANAKATKINYEQIASDNGYSVAKGLGGYLWYDGKHIEFGEQLYSNIDNCWKAACEDNGLLGESLG